MNTKNFPKNKGFSAKLVYLAVILCFTLEAGAAPLPQQAAYNLPSPDQFVPPSKTYSYPVLKGLRFHPENPLNIEFIIDTANQENITKEEAAHLVRYFLAGLTLNQDELWVNLSPHEKDRVASDNLCLTDLGKDMLSQDYILKQLTSSLTHPESNTGKTYWQKVHQELTRQFGRADMPINTFNKVWVMPEKSVVYEKFNTVFILKASLKAMHNYDYTAQKQNVAKEPAFYCNNNKEINKTYFQIFNDTILPKINYEVNQGKNFATLRQIYYSLVLATWFRRKFKNSFYRYYIDQGKISGIDLEDKGVKDRIYGLYVEAYKKGVYNYIKCDRDPATSKTINRRYYSGGFEFGKKINPEVMLKLPEKFIYVDDLCEGNVKLLGGIVNVTGSSSLKASKRKNWKTEKEGVANVVEALNYYRPQIMKKYANIGNLSNREKESLRREIYSSIKFRYFSIWDIVTALSKKVAPYFNGSYINALLAVFPKLDLNPLGFGPDWSTPQRGIDSVRYALNREVPLIMRRYDNLADLSPAEVELLRRDIYTIKRELFDLWDLNGANDKDYAPYFNGSYINALLAVFPKLDLNPLGFGPDWSTPQRGIDSVRYVLNREVPLIMRRYDNLADLSPAEVELLREDIYKIRCGRLLAWGLDGINDRRYSRSYVDILLAVFPKLNLNPLGFRPDWSTHQRGIDSVRYILSKKIPRIIQQYDNIDNLEDTQIKLLCDDICKLSVGLFKAWGLGGALTKKVAPYFKSSYINILLQIFDDPRLELNEEKIRSSGKGKARYKWTQGKEQGIANVIDGISRNRKDITERYSQIDKLNPAEIEILKNDIYEITGEYFPAWGLRRALCQSYFKNTYVYALILAFPKLNLNPLGFRPDWSTPQRRIDSVQYALNREVPLIMRRYDNLADLSPAEVELLRRDIYKIQKKHVDVWGIASISDVNTTPYFKGIYANALIDAFPKLNLNPLGFRPDWATHQRGIDSVRYALNREVPLIMRRYDNLADLSPAEVELLRRDIYKIQKKHVNAWGIGSVGDAGTTPYFKGTYINALFDTFPKLNLNRLGFNLDWSTPQQGIDSVSYVLKRELPLIMEKYENIRSLAEDQIDYLRKEILKINPKHFRAWSLDGALLKKSSPYFKGNYKYVLRLVFDRLNLEEDIELSFEQEEMRRRAQAAINSKDERHNFTNIEREAFEKRVQEQFKGIWETHQHRKYSGWLGNDENGVYHHSRSSHPYPRDVIVEKRQKLEKLGFTRKEILALMDYGVVGRKQTNTVDDAEIGGIDATADSFNIEITGKDKVIGTSTIPVIKDSLREDFDKLEFIVTFINDIPPHETIDSLSANPW